MSPLYDHAGLAAVVLTRIAAEESEGPGEMTGRMSEYIAGLVERNGPTAATELAIALARRQHFIALDTPGQTAERPGGAAAGCLGSGAAGKPR